MLTQLIAKIKRSTGHERSTGSTCCNCKDMCGFSYIRQSLNFRSRAEFGVRRESADLSVVGVVSAQAKPTKCYFEHICPAHESYLWISAPAQERLESSDWEAQALANLLGFQQPSIGYPHLLAFPIESDVRSSISPKPKPLRASAGRLEKDRHFLEEGSVAAEGRQEEFVRGGFGTAMTVNFRQRLHDLSIFELPGMSSKVLQYATVRSRSLSNVFGHCPGPCPPRIPRIPIRENVKLPDHGPSCADISAPKKC